MTKSKGLMATLFAGVALGVVAQASAKVIAVLDATQSTWSSTRRSVVFYDPEVSMDDPMFAVFVGYEQVGNFEDPGAITVDPATGDVYVLAYDSGIAGQVDGPDGDGDFDLYRIDYGLCYSDWQANGSTYKFYYTKAAPFQPQTAVPGAPYYPSGTSNQVELTGCIEKIGEIARNDSSEYYDYDIEFVDEDTLVLLDNQTGADGSNENPPFDHVIRSVRRVNVLPGNATYSSATNEGGFNNGATESWESIVLGLVHMDYDGGGQLVGRSNPVDISYAKQEAAVIDTTVLTDVEGVWILEADGGGDDVAFFEITDYDASGVTAYSVGAGYTEVASPVNGYREFSYGATSTALDEDPATDPTTNDGEGDWIIASPWGIIIGESGYFDTPNHEPKVLPRAVVNYGTDVFDTILFDAWLPYDILDLTGLWDDDSYVTDGRFVTYDYDAEQIYYLDIDSGSVPDVTADVYILDVSGTGTGATSGATTAGDGYVNGPNHFTERHGIRYWSSAPAAVPTILSTVSRKTHGIAGTFDIDSADPECRSGGPTQVVVTFDEPIQQVTGTTADVTLSSGTVSGLIVAGDKLIINMSGAADDAALTIGFGGIANAADVTKVVTDTACIRVQIGDNRIAPGPIAVNIFDLLDVRNALGTPVDATNFRRDVQANGSFNIFDLLEVRNNLNGPNVTCP